MRFVPWSAWALRTKLASMREPTYRWFMIPAALKASERCSVLVKATRQLFIALNQPKKT